MGKVGQSFRTSIKTCFGQQGFRFFLSFLYGSFRLNISESFQKYLAYVLQWIIRTARFLEDHADLFAPVMPQFFRAQI
jgi:hypothetical protein